MFFNISGVEAAYTDPQQRLFLQESWHALEDAGYAKEGYNGAIGLYAGASGNFQWQKKLKDSKKYAATGGWGYAQFDKEGKPGPESDMKKCFPCHQAVKDRDFVFTRYAP